MLRDFQGNRSDVKKNRKLYPAFLLSQIVESSSFGVNYENMLTTHIELHFLI